MHIAGRGGREKEYTCGRVKGWERWRLRWVRAIGRYKVWGSREGTREREEERRSKGSDYIYIWAWILCHTVYTILQFASCTSAIIPRYLQGISSRTCHRYQNLRMLMSHSWSSVSAFHICGFHQPRIVQYCGVYWKKSVYTWSRTVQILVVQGSSVVIL